MVQVLISSVSASIKRISEPVIIEGKTLIRSVSLGEKSSREPVDGGNKLLQSASISKTPYVLPGQQPTELVDLKTKVTNIC